MKEVSKLLDLESIPCPLNVVKFKLALEKLSLNEILIVHLDKGEPEEMIKKTLIEMNYVFEILEEDKKTLKLRVLNDN